MFLMVAMRHQFRYLIKKFAYFSFESNIWNKKKKDFSDKIISIALNYMEKKI